MQISGCLLFFTAMLFQYALSQGTWPPAWTSESLYLRDFKDVKVNKQYPSEGIIQRD